MKYMGSKARIAKFIMPIISKDRRQGQHHVEVFVGGGNTIQHAENPRIGSDSNESLIRALKLVRDGEGSIPRSNAEFAQEDYNKAKEKDLSNLTELECLMLFSLSFSGKFKGGFARGRKTEDFVRATKSNAKKQSPLIQGVKFIHSSYQDLKIPPNSIIYCDPPYEGATVIKINLIRLSFGSGAESRWPRVTKFLLANTKPLTISFAFGKKN